MKILIRQIKPDDLVQTQVAAALVMQTDFDYYSPEIKQQILNEDLDLAGRLTADDMTNWGAFNNDKMLGFLTGIGPIAGVVEIHWIMVLKESQGNGVGRKLLDELGTWAKNQGAHAIHLMSPEQNITFYENNGFENIGLVKRSYYDHDDYFMHKILSQ